METPTKVEFWRTWAIDGMPADKQRLAEAAWEGGSADLERELLGQEPVAWQWEDDSGICGSPRTRYSDVPPGRIVGARALYPAPVPPPDVRPSDDDLWDQTIKDRDHYHDMADKLAEAVGALLGVDVGEHSSVNCPWEVALEAYESFEVPDVRELRNAIQGLLDALPSATTHPAIKAARAALAKFRGQS